MSDPVYLKLKSDAGVVLTDLWRALRHQPPAEERVQPWQPSLESIPPTGTEPTAATSSGLCYFHLN